MDVSKMGKHVTTYDKALASHARATRAKTLVCPTCGAQNKPGTNPIDLDEYDDARCEKCGDIWQVAP